MAESAKCRRCLLRDVSIEDYRKYVESLLHTIPPRDRAPEAVYTARLDACRACDQLNGGTCMACGCLVELRAAYAKKACPFRRWISGQQPMKG